MDDTDFFSMMGTNMAGMDINPPAYILVCRAKDIDNLLGDTTITNSDYNAIKALVNGTINTYMGFKFVILPTTNFETGSSSDTFVYAYAPKAVKVRVLVKRCLVPLTGCHKSNLGKFAPQLLTVAPVQKMKAWFRLLFRLNGGFLNG